MAIVEPLQEIDKNCALHLASHYNDTKENRMVYTCLLNTSKIEERGGIIKFYKPVENNVQEFKIFFVFVTFEHSLEVRIFTLNPSHESIQNCIYRIVYYTQFLPMNKPNFNIVFRDSHEDIGAIVKIAIDDRGLNNIMLEIQDIHMMDKATRQNLRIEIPDEVTLEPLKEEDAEVIVTKGKYLFPPTSDYFRDIIRITGGYGVYSKKDHRLLTWGLKTVMGCIDFLGSTDEKTLVKYKHIVIKKLATELTYTDQMEVVVLNGPAAEVTKIGFEKAELCFLTIYCSPATDEEGEAHPSKKSKSSSSQDTGKQAKDCAYRLKSLKEDFKKLKKIGQKILITSSAIGSLTKSVAVQAGELIFNPIDKLFTYASLKVSDTLRNMSNTEDTSPYLSVQFLERIRNLEGSDGLFLTVGQVTAAKKQAADSDNDNSQSPPTESTTMGSDSSLSLLAENPTTIRKNTLTCMLADLLSRPPLDNLNLDPNSLPSFNSIKPNRALNYSDAKATPGPSRAGTSCENLVLSPEKHSDKSQKTPEKDSESPSKKDSKGKRKDRE